MLVLDGDALLDLLEFGAHPGVLGVAVGVQAGERLETFLDAAVVDEPAGGLGEEEDEEGEDGAGDDLDAEGDAPLAGVVVGEANVGAWQCVSCDVCEKVRGERDVYRRRCMRRRGHRHQA